MRKEICLDIGNVIATSDLKRFTICIDSVVTDVSNPSPDEVYEMLVGCQKSNDIGETDMSMAIIEFLQHNFGRNFFDRGEMDEIVHKSIESWKSILVPDANSISTITRMIDKGAKVALLSNMGFDHVEVLRHVLGDFIFDNSIKHISCFMKVRKPDPLYYELFLRNNPKFSGAIFVDDLQENLDGAEPFGFITKKMDLSDPSSSEKLSDIFSEWTI